MKQDLNNKQALVSIIMPTYNCAEYIHHALDSVKAQTYSQWEIIVVDDCSTDETGEVVRRYAEQDPRIQYYVLETHSGTAVARNRGVEIAKGRYLAFLDSDDIWFENKLEKQLRFMQQNGFTFTCTAYTKIDKQGNDLNRVIRALPVSDYDTILKRNPGNSTVIYDAWALGKFYIPDIKKRNDYVMWLHVIKKAKYLYGFDEVLGGHRIRTGSLSKNKLSLVKYHWITYRKIERLSFFHSVYLIVYWVFKTVFKLDNSRCKGKR